MHRTHFLVVDAAMTGHMQLVKVDVALFAVEGVKCLHREGNQPES